VNRLVTSAVVGAGALVLLAGTAVGGYTLHHPGSRTVTVTHTKIVPKTITVTKWKTHTLTKWKTRTVTVTSPPAAASGAAAQTNACISDLFQMIEGWVTASGSSVANYSGGTATVPSGWWLGPPCPPNG
jgi:hypothetical protein